MKLAVISDIHANYIALQKALEYIKKEKIDTILFLGDYITDLPYPQRTMEIIYKAMGEFNTHFIRGNREEYLIDFAKDKEKWQASSNFSTFIYTYENLTKKDLDFFSSLPISKEIRIDNLPGIFICHGSPYKTKDWLYKKDDLTYEHIKDIDLEYFIFGHTHRYYEPEFSDKKLVFCPSLGLPANKKPEGQFLILESKENYWTQRLVTIDYDKSPIYGDFETSGLLDMAKTWSMCIIKQLETGFEVCNNMLTLAKQKASDDSFVQGFLPERYLSAAAKELGIY